MDEFTCARSSVPIDEQACCQIILGTETSEELILCRTCQRGHMLAASCLLAKRLMPDMPPVASAPVPFIPAQHIQETAPKIQPSEPQAKDVNAAKAESQKKPAEKSSSPKKRQPKKRQKAEPRKEKLFPKLLAYVLRCYPAFKTHGIGFLHGVSKSQFGYTGSQEDMLKEAQDFGLTLLFRSSRYSLAVDEKAKSLARSVK